MGASNDRASLIHAHSSGNPWTMGIPAPMLTSMTFPWSPLDPLGEALHILRLHGTYCRRCEFTAAASARVGNLEGRGELGS